MREQLAQRDALIKQMQEQITALTQRVQTLEARLSNTSRYDCSHALCLVHLLRELTFLEEEQSLQWAKDLKALLLDMKEATEHAREQGKLWLDPLEVGDWETRFLELLAEGDQAHPRATAPPGQKGRCKQILSALQATLLGHPVSPSFQTTGVVTELEEIHAEPFCEERCIDALFVTKTQKKQYAIMY